MKYTIITPTILRPTLTRTCASIDNQTVKPSFEHIVYVDKGDLSANDFELIASLQKPYRTFILGGKSTNNYGNTPRHEAGKLAKGEFLMYIDDDDYYVPDLFQKIEDNVRETTDIVIFSALRHNEVFFNIPAGLCKTTSCQWAHRRIIEGRQILWTDTWAGNQDYLIDGRFLESVLNMPNINIQYIDSDPLVIIPESNYGK